MQLYYYNKQIMQQLLVRYFTNSLVVGRVFFLMNIMMMIMGTSINITPKTTPTI